jgi:serine/threonine protein kinase
MLFLNIATLISHGDPNSFYKKIKKVGQGASGSVYVAKDLKTHKFVAIKQMDLNSQPRKELLINEIRIMKESQHPNIVNYQNSFLLRNTELWVVMDYMEGGSLTDIIDNNKMDEGQIACTVYQAFNGLAHLHEKSIIHRDIKSDNVLLDLEGNVKLSKIYQTIN